MNSNQDANWCVTRPWFDYVMGTRVASSRELLESNLTGISLPRWVEKPLNTLIARALPQVLRQVEANITAENTVKLNASL